MNALLLAHDRYPGERTIVAVQYVEEVDRNSGE